MSSFIVKVCRSYDKISGRVNIEKGLQKIFELNKGDLIVEAPVGTYFLKPSGSKCSIFIRAASALLSSDYVDFIAYGLLFYRPKHKIRQIWIDTATISPVACSLLLMFNKFSSESKHASWHSFKSYGGFYDKLPPVGDGLWVIVSASMSNNMGRSIYKEIESIENFQIITIFSGCSSTTDGEGDSVLLDISGQLPKINDNVPDIELKVVGEGFYYPVKEPFPIVLKGMDKPKSIGGFLDKLWRPGVLSVYRSRSQRRRTFDFDFVGFMKISELVVKFKEWLNRSILWGFPISLEYVVYDPSDDGSVKLLELVEEVLDKTLIRLDYDDVSSIKPDSGVLALSPVLSTGRIFVKLNSDLRIAGHDGMRIFLSPFCFFENELSFLNFKNSLCYGPDGFKYKFFSYKSLMVGSQYPELWVKEYEWLSNHTSKSEVFSERISDLDEVNGLSSIGLKLTGVNFTPDFAFWGKGYHADKVVQASVYWTISSILQGLRDRSLDIAKKERSLFYHVTQYSVLDPENFVRFNDPLIQSCLWRAARRSEVNYSGSPDLSRRFVDILKKLIFQSKRDEPSAALDIMFGISIGWIVIDEKSRESLSSFISTQDFKSENFSVLINEVTQEYDNKETELIEF